jgi:hypothetical protein
VDFEISENPYEYVSLSAEEAAADCADSHGASIAHRSSPGQPASAGSPQPRNSSHSDAELNVLEPSGQRQKRSRSSSTQPCHRQAQQGQHSAAQRRRERGKRKRRGNRRPNKSTTPQRLTPRGTVLGRSSAQAVLLSTNSLAEPGVLRFSHLGTVGAHSLPGQSQTYPAVYSHQPPPPPPGPSPRQARSAAIAQAAAAAAAAAATAAQQCQSSTAVLPPHAQPALPPGSAPAPAHMPSLPAMAAAQLATAAEATTQPAARPRTAVGPPSEFEAEALRQVCRVGCQTYKRVTGKEEVPSNLFALVQTLFF